MNQTTSSNEIVLQLNPGPGNGRNSEASFVTLESGRILMVWTRLTVDGNHDFDHAILATRYSDDAGLTWSEDDEVLITQEGTISVFSPSFLRLQDGRIALLYLRKDHNVSGTINCMPVMRFSDDECETFSDPVPMIEAPGYYVVNNDRLIQTKTGRLIAPVSMHRFRLPSELPPGQKRTHFHAEPGLIFYLFSDDGGQMWLESLTSYYHCDETGHGLQEPGIIELSDGRLWGWSRFGMMGLSGMKARQWQSFSEDGCNVWSQPQPSEFVSPCSPMSVKRVPQTGDLLAVWNDQSDRYDLPPAQESSWGRTPLACALSKDDGRSWQHHKLLEDAPDQGFCYTAIHFTDDAVLLAYDAGGAQSKTPLDTTRVRRIAIDELYA